MHTYMYKGDLLAHSMLILAYIFPSITHLCDFLSDPGWGA